MLTSVSSEEAAASTDTLALLEVTVVQARQNSPTPIRAERWPPDLDEWIADAERQLRCALAQSQASVRSCQSALSAVADLRARIDDGAGDALPAVMHNVLIAPGYRPPKEPGITSPRRQIPAIVQLARVPEPIQGGALSPREIEVLALVAQGRSNKAIARHLYLSIRTVERHINNIYRKIGAQNRAEATAFVLRHDLA